MTESEARNILLQHMEQSTNREHPLAWVGNLVEDDDYSFVFEATIYAHGNNPRKHFHHWFVNKDIRGGHLRCGPVLE